MCVDMMKRWSPELLLGTSCAELCFGGSPRCILPGFFLFPFRCLEKLVDYRMDLNPPTELIKACKSNCPFREFNRLGSDMDLVIRRGYFWASADKSVFDSSLKKVRCACILIPLRRRVGEEAQRIAHHASLSIDRLS